MASRAASPLATSVARLETDEQAARRLADLLADSFAADDVAVSLFDAGGGRWQVAIYFRAASDRAGSGVLAIAAARALRRRVLATDIDASAVRAARANARLNRTGAMVKAVKADGVTAPSIRQRAPFDLVFANILLGPLQRIAAPLKKLVAPGGRVVVSGLLPAQANAAMAAYRPLVLERRIDLDGWTTLVLTQCTRRRGTSI